MITLKLNNYTKEEVKELAHLLESLQPQLHTHCPPLRECRVCPVRHICMDVAQATMYAEEYTPNR